MHPIETALFDYMVNNGVDRDTAFTASQNCARAVRNGALSGFVVGFTVGIETMNPSALLMGGVGAAGGAGVALAISRQAAARSATLPTTGRTTPWGFDPESCSISANRNWTRSAFRSTGTCVRGCVRCWNLRARWRIFPDRNRQSPLRMPRPA